MFQIGLVFPLRAGGQYSLLSAANFRGRLCQGDRIDSAETLIVGMPLTFSVPDDCGNAPILYEGAQVGVEPHGGQGAAQPVAGRWETYSRFAGAPYGGLQLVAHADNSATLRLALQNVCSEPIHVTKWRGNSDYEILIRDSGGKPAAITEKGRKFFQSSKLLDGLVLQPGDHVEAKLPLSGLFDLRSPSEYNVLASLPVIGDVDAILTAAPVRIRTDANPAPRSK
jgi:hypothetical protein